MNDMKPPYPIILRWEEFIPGKGYIAQVKATGRALLLDEEEGDWWLYGVQPGGMAECGETTAEAVYRFRDSLKVLLSDLAADASTFETFKAEVELYFNQVNDEQLGLWADAVRKVREHQRIDDEYVSGLPRNSAATECLIHITKIDEPFTVMPERAERDPVAVFEEAA